MAWRRSASVLLALLAAAALVAWLGVRGQQPPLAAGSSLSYQPDGLQALFLWEETLGARAARFEAIGFDATGRPSQVPSVLPATPAAGTPGAAPDLWMVVQPARAISAADRERLEAVPRNGGTLLLAGDSLALRQYLSTLDLSLAAAPVTAAATAVTTPGGAALPFASRYRLVGSGRTGATPLLLDADGGWLALRKPYLNGSLVVLATSYPLTNAGLQRRETARFVFRELLARHLPGGAITFDESLLAPPTVAEESRTTFAHLVFGTAPGWAALYAATLTFLYLGLSGRRFGPALLPVQPAETSRTMYEHVQALAGIYQRAGQFAALRTHYARLVQRAEAPAAVVAAVEGARSEAALLATVARAHDSLQSPSLHRPPDH